MHRAPIVLSATAAGVAGVIALNPGAASSGPVAEAPLPNLAAASTASSRPSGVFLGPAVSNQYGKVQVQVALSGGRLVDARAVRLPNGDGQSQQISREAGPLLKQQALQARAGKVDGVSGATYTSDGYRQSLQAALDRGAQRASTTSRGTA